MYCRSLRYLRLTSEIPVKFTGRAQILNFKILGNCHSTTDLIFIDRAVLATKLHKSALGQPKWTFSPYFAFWTNKCLQIWN